MKLFGGKTSRHSNGKIAEDRRDTAQLHQTVGDPGKTEKTAGKRIPVKILRVLITVVIILVLIAAAVLIVYAIWEKAPDIDASGPNTYATPLPSEQGNTSSTPEITLPPATPEPGDDETPAPTEEPVPTGRNENCYTFVIAANDQIGANTDTILVGRLDVEAGTLNVVSIPRDTLVNVEWGVKKVNTILANRDSDPEQFVKGLGDILGFTPDCYAIVSMGVVEALVNTMGGVLYTVPRDMHYDDPSQDLSIHINAGYQWLNGEDAVKVLRFRVGNDGTGYPTGDMGRIATQQDFLMSMAKQMLSLGNIPNLSRMLEIVEEYVKTNLEANNIAYLLREFLLLDEENIQFHTLPGEGVYIRGGSYYQVKLDEWTEMINEYINPYYDQITAENLNVLQFIDTKEGALSTSGERVPYNSFFDFSNYKG